MTKKNKLGTQHDERNLFGGKNPRGNYVPMTEVEQEVLHRLVDADDLVLLIHGWGRNDKPQIIVGDHRVGIDFRITFNRPDKPMPVYFFDLELTTRAGRSVAKERLPVMYGGKPLTAQRGIFYDMHWDIAISSLSPELVREVLPNFTGLSSRRQDRDTGLMTATGNMKLSPKQKAALDELESGYAKMRSDDLKQVFEATKKAGYKVKKTTKGWEAPDLV